MDKNFSSALRRSLYIHTPLNPERGDSINKKSLKKPIKQKMYLDNQKVWHSGLGSIQVCGENRVTVTAPVMAGEFPEGSLPFGEYTCFGRTYVHFELEDLDCSMFNALFFSAEMKTKGVRGAHVIAGIVNDGAVKIPDIYKREGEHVVHLREGEKIQAVWEFPELPRDCVKEIFFYVLLNGKDTASNPEFTLAISDVAFIELEDPQKYRGWEPEENEIILPYEGYWKNGSKTALVKGEKREFFVKNTEKEIVFSGIAEQVSNELGDFSLLDFSSFCQTGKYTIACDGIVSEEFFIDKIICEEALWKVLNFIYCERCGCPIPHKHGKCHDDIFADFNGLKMPYNGGWHDAGDVSQQTLHSAEVIDALLEAAEVQGGVFAERALEEAAWGIDFLLKTRLGNGFRITSAPATRWTQGRIGDMDDIPARVHDLPFENFSCSAIEAHAAQSMQKYDLALADACERAAREDYYYAVERFDAFSNERPSMYEHSYILGKSQFYAAASLAASRLFMLTNEKKFADDAVKYAETVLDCQEKGSSGLSGSGFFYRDESKKEIVHFNHQSREHTFMQMLYFLCRTQPHSPRLAEWEKAMRLYGDYIKWIIQYTFPYGMIPAGIYRFDETDFKETFQYSHLLANYEDSLPHYKEQLKNGHQLDENHVLRRFPVWFSFRGNTVVHLSQGKAAAIVANYFNDNTLLDIAREQVYWTLGKNPFHQSLLFGVGRCYSSQYAVFPNDTVGAIPVGIQTRGDEDIPFWPYANNATYKEVWIASASQWISLVAELID